MSRTSSTPGYTGRVFERPRVVMSQCLELEACRYDGQRIRNSFIRQLMDHIEILPVCPEVEIGLGVPRDTIRLVANGDKTLLIQPSTEKDLTEEMERFSRGYIDKLGKVDGFILKSGSPTCGTSQVKVYAKAEKSQSVRREAGLFAREILEKFDDLSVEDEGRLRNFDIRHHFLTRLFSLADLRALGEKPTIFGIAEFQRRYKHLLYVYDETGMRELGRIAANREDLEIEEVYELYSARLRKALAREPKRNTHVNALTHIYGHFKNQLPDAEKSEFFAMVDEMLAHHLPLTALLVIIRSWCARFENEYFADQAYLEPYPRALIQMRDSGKGLEF